MHIDGCEFSKSINFRFVPVLSRDWKRDFCIPRDHQWILCIEMSTILNMLSVIFVDFILHFGN